MPFKHAGIQFIEFQLHFKTAIKEKNKLFFLEKYSLEMGRFYHQVKPPEKELYIQWSLNHYNVKLDAGNSELFTVVVLSMVE